MSSSPASGSAPTCSLSPLNSAGLWLAVIQRPQGAPLHHGPAAGRRRHRRIGQERPHSRPEHVEVGLGGGRLVATMDQGLYVKGRRSEMASGSVGLKAGLIAERAAEDVRVSPRSSGR